MAPIYLRSPLLRCGNDSYGYRHIQKRHMADWAPLASMLGSDWRTFTDWAVDQSLHYPKRWCLGSNNEVLYIGYIQIKNSSGQVVGTYYPRVPVGKTTNNIITAFPQTSPSGC